MNAILYGSMCLFAWVGFLRNVYNKKQSKLSVIVGIILFVLSVASRQFGYFSYSDLKSYIWRFQNNENAYFGFAYKVLCDLIRTIFGTNINGYFLVICMITLGTAIIAVKIWNGKISTVYISSFLLVYVVYWGVSFSAEVIRAGMAISLSLLAIALMRNKKWILVIPVMTLSIAFHWTEIFIIPILILLYFSEKFKKKPLQESLFYLWMVLLLFCDFIDIGYFLSKGLAFFMSMIISNLAEAEHYLRYLRVTPHSSLFSYISLQYVYYRLLGLLLVYIHRKSNSSKVLLISYFCGLTVYSVMNSFVAVTRMQWVFAVPSVFLFYDYIRSPKGLKKDKVIIISILVIVQMVMAINYLGLHLRFY